MAATVLLAGLAVTGGCGGDDQVVQAPPPPPPPAPVVDNTPRVLTVDNLMAEMGVSDKVLMSESNAPASTESRRAVLEFFDAFVRSQDTRVAPLLAEGDRPFLDLMVDLGTWEPVTSSIESVTLVAGTSPESRPAILGMFVRDGEDEYQMWYYDIEAGQPTFEAAPTPPGIVSELSGLESEYIAQWHDILTAEMELASQPDAEFIKLDVNLDEESGETSAGPSANTPSPGGGGGGRRHTPTRQRRPPGVPY
ncbi:MAG: hypothetical protein AB8G96_09790 [Phycisphaerales bacterium]